MTADFEAARRKYKPAQIRYLLVAEAPPRESSGRFFYFEDVCTGDSLFLETMKVLYPTETLNPKGIRREKRRFLERFKDEGFYLIDSIDVPIADSRQKRSQIRRALPKLRQKLSELATDNVKIVLISETVYEVCANTLKSEGFNVINDEMIDFPGSGGQAKFRQKLAKLLKMNGWSAGSMFQPRAPADWPN